MTDSLLSRLQSLTGPDREIDAYIALENGWTKNPGGRCWLHADGSGRLYDEPPRYTESLDAIRSLMPTDLYWMVAKGKTRPAEPLYGVQILKTSGWPNDIIAEAEHDLLEVALLIAIYRMKGIAIMTTARNAIATILCNAAGEECGCDGRACGQIADGLLADESVRLELAGKLNPQKLPTQRCDECDNGVEEDWNCCAWCGYSLTLPAPPPEDKP